MQDQPSMRQACCFKQTIRVGFIHCLPLLAGSFGSAVGERTRNNCTRVSVGFIYLVARLAWQWKNFYGVLSSYI